MELNELWSAGMDYQLLRWKHFTDGRDAVVVEGWDMSTPHPTTSTIKGSATSGTTSFNPPFLTSLSHHPSSRTPRLLAVGTGDGSIEIMAGWDTSGAVGNTHNGWNGLEWQRALRLEGGHGWTVTGLAWIDHHVSITRQEDNAPSAASASSSTVDRQFRLFSVSLDGKLIEWKITLSPPPRSKKARVSRPPPKDPTPLWKWGYSIGEQIETGRKLECLTVTRAGSNWLAAMGGRIENDTVDLKRAGDIELYLIQ
ncbi:hypothetical protein M427DRAFT_166139 [Gonapodya prolifera JEL478]|uniref:WD40 repeat-like protein n=1 Tax=Gonapodya prolifera (strain JEL478) TaxID=1344416 RepID=A0A139B023_GONPJ|nr:hypothetical protein M427DRAFT_166139 [Gonapodya prolifera JEL478]|eukprot:KXS22153.1 hypothetical protein M427DRAFT_166139 [Gonapodya prolifera JEL478]